MLFWIKSWIFEISTQKNFWEDFGTKRTFRQLIGHISATSDWILDFWISKNHQNGYIQAKFKDFFAKIKFQAKINRKSSKMIFFDFFGSQKLFLWVSEQNLTE